MEEYVQHDGRRGYFTMWMYISCALLTLVLGLDLHYSLILAFAVLLVAPLFVAVMDILFTEAKWRLWAWQHRHDYDDVDD